MISVAFGPLSVDTGPLPSLTSPDEGRRARGPRTMVKPLAACPYLQVVIPASAISHNVKVIQVYWKPQRGSGIRSTISDCTQHTATLRLLDTPGPAALRSQSCLKSLQLILSGFFTVQTRAAEWMRDPNRHTWNLIEPCLASPPLSIRHILQPETFQVHSRRLPIVNMDHV